ncbi:hypothetical protein [Flavobacterium orientale]|uniref:HTH cro/C1-type domain-containing protein n=1 Tax=Flavobacterium orientale TaxID=1756020 RepID=A0A917DH89_9FLAO|nr:hypothetical protein [Flavobacterium orientale]GGD35314.1 hypothetical protein GCM10011343_26450 [Flavobacterium orientale]
MQFHAVKEHNKKYLLAFGQNLERLLQELDTDVMTVASLGNIEPKQVYRVLRGEHAASLGTILAISRGLAVPPKKLFDFDFTVDQEP